ncbi:hypothetical protein [Winogradskyella thalassocola]|uniref:Uncharacterized protein n=1 Tax=Winogradskyella thalassocola TaxID=262004 RepID=A0A1G8M8H8_9FLAO|nr:hypothetical protein [Winogradskyella thalassocola]SDI64137.1 hypothetical protein SAMN04489796_1188 [Winogradskyella thalassocola]
MREKLLTNLNNALNQYNELQQYSNVLPENLMNGAKSAMEESIPNAGNEILSLLNSVSGKQVFENQNSVTDLITLLTNRADEINTAFGLVPVNENIMGFDGGKTYTAKDILDYQSFWFNAHCDTINTTLTAGRITAEHYKK